MLKVEGSRARAPSPRVRVPGQEQPSRRRNGRSKCSSELNDAPAVPFWTAGIPRLRGSTWRP
eukprot:8123602-Alexandrium_andersonii.AAC.1